MVMVCTVGVVVVVVVGVLVLVARMLVLFGSFDDDG